MKPFLPLLLGVALLGVVVPPGANRGPKETCQPSAPTAASQDVHQAVNRLEAWATQVRATASQSGARSAAGNLWIEAGRLKRAGVNVRAIDYYTADLEHSLRVGQGDAIARKHAQNNLDYEIQALRCRVRR